MTVLDVTRNRHLESDGQEIRVRHDFLPHFFCCLSYTGQYQIAVHLVSQTLQIVYQCHNNQTML